MGLILQHLLEAAEACLSLKLPCHPLVVTICTYLSFPDDRPY